MTRYVYAVFAVAALLVSPAQAQGVFQQSSVKVFYGDLDLSKPAGMQTLKRRLTLASLEVCGDSCGALRIGTNDQARCAHDAVANALAAVGKAQNRIVADNGQKSSH
jgi:UrcA family protein